MSLSAPPSPPESNDDDRRARRKRNTAIVGAGLAAAIAVSCVAALGSFSSPPAPNPAVATTPAPKQSTELAQTMALPLADYKAVIPGLIPFDETVDTAVQVGALTTTAPIYGAERDEPVARLNKTDFLGKPTPVVVVQRDGAWSKILTPSRVSLPSASGGDAPAQSAAWIRSTNITNLHSVADRVDVDLHSRTLTVTYGGKTQRFDVGIGMAGTPTPSAVSGYLEARYVDERQGTGEHPIQLTSLHVETEDTPVAGGVGGVVAMHYYDARSGAVSHGCLRLSAEAVAAVDALPAGSIVTVAP